MLSCILGYMHLSNAPLRNRYNQRGDIVSETFIGLEACAESFGFDLVHKALRSRYLYQFRRPLM